MLFSGTAQRDTILISTTRDGVFHKLVHDLDIERMEAQFGAWYGWYAFQWQNDVWLVSGGDLINLRQLPPTA